MHNGKALMHVEMMALSVTYMTANVDMYIIELNGVDKQEQKKTPACVLACHVTII